MATQALSAGGVLDLADAAQGAGTAARGRLLLGAARPAWSERELDGASLGERDACVLALRCATFGERLEGRTLCAACGAQLALEVDASVLRVADAPDFPRAGASFEVVVDRYRLTVRSPYGMLLAAAETTRDHDLARRTLVMGCVVDARVDDGEVAVDQLPDDIVAAAGAAIVERDPQAEVLLDLTCVACGYAWMCVFDAGAFLDAELGNLAAHLVEDVHTLANAYGWSEDQVLALPSRRRRRYVKRAAGE